ncbi:hypothetical protein [Streptacidiphilus anmyonensis]|uniref:hypothetical protein n=1 Tax=Streptacidiphilus anmyonensis TaxID=405782 RepID=UPI0005A92577|nr:hypothetical protein [Streptacidiphilus anmyonensis]
MAPSHLPTGRLVPSTALSLRVGDWVELDGRSWQVTDLRYRCDGGRIVHFGGRPPHVMGPRATIPVHR